MVYLCIDRNGGMIISFRNHLSELSRDSRVSWRKSQLLTSNITYRNSMYLFTDAGRTHDVIIFNIFYESVEYPYIRWIREKSWCCMVIRISTATRQNKCHYLLLSDNNKPLLLVFALKDVIQLHQSI